MPKSDATIVAATPQDIQAVVDDINLNVLVERERVMRVLTIGALAGVNINQLGPAGTAKSLMSREFCKRIVGARFFSKTMHAMMPADAVIGAIDMPALANDGEFKRNVEHYLPNAHVGFLDEWSRANGPTLDAFLPMLNVGERIAEGNGGMFKTPLLFVVLASNFTPPADDPQFGALVDRITLSQYIEYVQADASFEDMLLADHKRRLAEQNGSQSQPVTLTLDQFVGAQHQVREVTYSADFRQEFSKFRKKVRGEGLMISDRAFMELGLVAKANAWLSGRDECNKFDISAVEDGLWRDKDDRPIARQLVLPYQSKFVQAAAKRRAETEPHLAKLLELRPLVEGVVSGQPVPPEVMSKVQAVSRALGDANKRVGENIASAEKAQENVPDLRELHAELQAAKKWLDQNYLPASWPAP